MLEITWKKWAFNLNLLAKKRCTRGYMAIHFSAKMLGLGVLAMGLVSLSFGRVGPVSAYGQLQAGKNSSGKGQIYGACKGVADGAEVAVQGMSLFWSIASDVGAPFWTAEDVNKLVKEQNIQLIRAPMGVDEDWYAGNYFTKTNYYQGLMNTVVQAAIDNDIYVIIDYHSHKASEDVNSAKTFFSYMAQQWGSYDNVIFEIFNEPTSQSWGTIKTYADEVVKTIRQYSDNLIVVGNRSWDQYPNEAKDNPVADSKNNIAYTFHFYAGSHSTGKEGANAVSAMNGGLSVFVTEWGTVDASGNGGYNSGNSKTWLDWMKTHKLSGANWSVSNKSEDASYYTGSRNNLSYSTSGQWVNSNIFASLPKSYTACDGTPVSSSSAASSSSYVQPAGTTDYIDNLEDGDGYTFTGGEWYAYNDSADKGASTISNAKGKKGGYDVVVAGSKAGNSSKYVAGITGVKLSQGNNKYDPYVALGLSLNAKQTAYDLSACTQISYKYKGAAHNFKTEDTAVKDYGYHQIHKSASDTWTTVTIPWDMLSQEAWPDPVTLSQSRIAKFTWEIKGDQPSLDYLYVDDVRCTGMAIALPASSSSSARSSSSIASSSSAKSSSSVASSSSAKSSSSSARSSSSVASSSSAKSSSSVASSSSAKSSSSSARSSSSIASSSSAKSSSSVASSSSAKLSSSVASSSSVESSSSEVVVESSSSETMSSSSVAPSSSSAAPVVVVVGEMAQSLEVGSAIEPIVFENVDAYRRDWGMYYLNFSEISDGKFTVTGTIPSHIKAGTYTEKITIRDSVYSIVLTVAEKEEHTTHVTVQNVNPLNLSVEGRVLHIGGAEWANVNVFDMQGRPVASFKQVKGSVSLDMLHQGSYIVRVRSKSNSLIYKISLK